MSNNFKTLQGYITLTPIYEQDDHTTTKTTTIEFEEPIGRKELATIWWKHCPNHCQAHLPRSKKPCLRYCKQLRKNVSILSKQMLTLEHIAEQNESCNNNISISNHEQQRRRHQLIKHPHAIQKNQSKLIHIAARINESYTHQIFCDNYDLHIGKDYDHPWMHFHVSVHPQEQSLTTIRTPNTIATTTTPITKRKLVFDFNNNNDRSMPNREKHSHKRKRTNDDRGRIRLTNHEDETCNIPYSCSDDMSNVINAVQCNATITVSSWMEKSNDIPSYHSDESGNSSDVDPISTQQIISEKCYTIPAVTPGTVIKSNRSHTTITKPIVDDEAKLTTSTSIRLLSQRRLFHNNHDNLPDNVTGTGIPVMKTQNTFFNIEKPLFVQNSKEHVSQTETNLQSQSYFGIQDDYVRNDYEIEDENEQFSTYLSLPIPESDTGSLVDNIDTLVMAPTKHDSNTSTLQVDSIHNHQQTINPTRRKLFDMKLNDWQNLKSIEEQRSINDPKTTTTTQFHKAMIELILLKNQEHLITIHTSTNNQSSLWLPSIISHETMLSSLWNNLKEGSHENNDK